MNNSKDYLYKNKNYNLGFQNNNFYNKNIDSQKNIAQAQYNNQFTTINNNIHSNQYNNNFILPQNISEFGDIVDNDNDNNNSNNNKRIINQNCFQINIENMNIHNSINNISQNYNINTTVDNDNENNISINFQNDNNTSNMSKVSYNSMNITDILNNIEKISENQTGCRLLQNKLQQNSDKANDFYKSMKSKKILKKMTIDSFGNYLIQKLLEYISSDLISEFFINIICPSFMEISLNPHGSRVIQKLLDCSKDEEKKRLNKEINKIIIDLCLDQYGNYVIQHVLETNKGKNCEDIFKAFKGKVYEMSIHKYASNVIERCLHYGLKEEKESLIDEIILKDDKFDNSLISLVKDKYGNYVVQKMIEYSNKGKKDEIIKKILNSPSINKNDGYTKHVLKYIEKFGYTIPNNNIDYISSDNSSSNSNQKDNILNINNDVSKVVNNNYNSFLNNNINNININENSDSDSSYFKDEDYEDIKIGNENDDVNDEIIKKNEM